MLQTTLLDPKCNNNSFLLVPSNVDKNDFHLLISGGSLISVAAAFINACCLIEFSEGVGHHTGNIGRVGVNAYNKQSVRLVLGAMGFFLCGSAIASLSTGGPKFKHAKRYGLALMFESTLVAVSTQTSPMWRLFLLSLALGFQNGLVGSMTKFVSVRTTHITGSLTDIGTELGLWIRACFSPSGREHQTWKLKLLIPCLLAHVLGSFLGAWCYQSFRNKAMWFPAGLLFASGFTYFVLRYCTDLMQPKQSKRARKNKGSANFDGADQETRLDIKPLTGVPGLDVSNCDFQSSIDV